MYSLKLILLVAISHHGFSQGPNLNATKISSDGSEENNATLHRVLEFAMDEVVSFDSMFHTSCRNYAHHIYLYGKLGENCDEACESHQTSCDEVDFDCLSPKVTEKFFNDLGLPGKCEVLKDHRNQSFLPAQDTNQICRGIFPGTAKYECAASAPNVFRICRCRPTPHLKCSDLHERDTTYIPSHTITNGCSCATTSVDQFCRLNSVCRVFLADAQSNAFGQKMWIGLTPKIDPPGRLLVELDCYKLSILSDYFLFTLPYYQKYEYRLCLEVRNITFHWSPPGVSCEDFCQGATNSSCSHLLLSTLHADALRRDMEEIAFFAQHPCTSLNNDTQYGGLVQDVVTGECTDPVMFRQSGGHNTCHKHQQNNRRFCACIPSPDVVCRPHGEWIETRSLSNITKQCRSYYHKAMYRGSSSRYYRRQYPWYGYVILAEMILVLIAALLAVCCRGKLHRIAVAQKDFIKPKDKPISFSDAEKLRLTKMQANGIQEIPTISLALARSDSQRSRSSLRNGGPNAHPLVNGFQNGHLNGRRAENHEPVIELNVVDSSARKPSSDDSSMDMEPEFHSATNFSRLDSD